MNMTYFIAAWAVCGIVTLSLAVYRKFITAHEDDLIHLADGEASHIPEQTALAKKLASVEHWGKVFTVFTVVIGAGLAAVYIYRAWAESGMVGLK